MAEYIADALRSLQLRSDAEEPAASHIDESLIETNTLTQNHTEALDNELDDRSSFNISSDAEDERMFVCNNNRYSMKTTSFMRTILERLD